MQAKVLRTTIAKQSTVQARLLAPQFKTELKPGTYDIIRWAHASNGHQRVTFANKMGNFQTWLLWGDDIQCDNESKKIQLRVPYYSQRDNRSAEWWRQCNTSSHAMILNFLKPGSVASDDDYFQRFVQPNGDSTDWTVHTNALKRFGIDSVYRQDLDFADLEKSLELGFPVAIGVLHNGPIASPTGGHVLVITGMDKDKSVFYANDPWGVGFRYTNFNGENVEYPIQPSLDRRWLADGDKSGWGRLITAIDGKPTGLS
ncbi:MAG: C39 family peptidase [Leptolyngbyaceae cyanobacterium bins.349]|nr:C39 family peptidase [Leptolyngbyaceae cyanobacterium bins.349]